VLLLFLEFDFPDKYHLRFLDEGILEILLQRLKTDIDSTCLMIAKALTKLASKSKDRIRYKIYRGVQISYFETPRSPNINRFNNLQNYHFRRDKEVIAETYVQP
jgi:hypothetical protein